MKTGGFADILLFILSARITNLQLNQTVTNVLKILGSHSSINTIDFLPKNFINTPTIYSWGKCT